MIRIGVVDDHAITRSALCEHFASPVEFRVVGQGATPEDAVTLAVSGEIDVLVLDLQLGVRSAFDTLSAIVTEAPQVRVLVLSGMPEEVYGPAVLAAGAAGFVNKSAQVHEIISSVRAVAAGQRVAPLSVRSVQPQLHHALSKREMEVFLMLAAGKRLTQVASDMSLSIKTASTYRARILTKMNMRSNTAMTHYAVAHGLIA